MAEAKNSSVNYCVWANRLITDVGAKLWNKTLIDKGFMYISDFLTEDKSIMTYEQFREAKNLSILEISSSDYVKIKMAIRRYDCPTIITKSISNIDHNTMIDFFCLRDSPIKGGKIREVVHQQTVPE